MTTVRTASAADEPDITDLLVASDRRPWSAEAIVPRADRLVLVAERDGEIVGCARTHRLLQSDGDAPSGQYLGGLVVRPDARRLGIGRALTLARLDWLRGRATVVNSIVNRANGPSLALHRRMGFREVACSTRFGSVAADRDGDVLVLLELRLSADVARLDGGA